MTDPRIEKLANVLVNYSVTVQPGDKVLVQGDTPTGPLLKAVYAKVLQAGGHPLMLVSLPGIDELFYRYASDEQLQHVPEPIKLVVESYERAFLSRAAKTSRQSTGICSVTYATGARSGWMTNCCTRMGSL